MCLFPGTAPKVERKEKKKVEEVIKLSNFRFIMEFLVSHSPQYQTEQL